MQDKDVRARVAELGPWFHNLDLNGVETAPDHFLWNYPASKFAGFAHIIPEDLTGKTVLDIGCNAGFYSFEMARRGAARVVGIDEDDDYLQQARFAAGVLGYADRVEFQVRSVYDVAALGEVFDLVIFMGVFYHLRHPLLALDLIRAHVSRDLLLFQSLQRGAEGEIAVAPDYDFFDPVPFDDARWPKLHFVEHRFAHDQTNWFIPNEAASAAMLRAAGFSVEAHPEPEVFLCRVAEVPEVGAVYPARGPMEPLRLP